MNKPNVKFSLTLVREFYYKWDCEEFPHLRMGQAFYNYFDLHKMQSDREWFDCLYQADGVEASRLINSITDNTQ